MTKKFEPLTRFLLPIGKPDSFQRATKMAGCLASALDERIEAITLLHIMAGRYLSRHMANVDVRTDYILESETFKRLKSQHIENEVQPLLDQAAKHLRQYCAACRVEKKVADGKPVDQILKLAVEGHYSTILMEKRELSRLKQFFLGSVSESLLQRNVPSSVYLVGQDIHKDLACPLPRILVAVDGSADALQAAAEAGILANRFGAGIQELVLLRVVNAATYGERVANGEKPEQQAKAQIDAALNVLNPGRELAPKIVRLEKFGDPAEAIWEETDKRDIDIIFMGRRGTNPVSEMFIGHVCRVVSHKCQRPTIVFVST